MPPDRRRRLLVVAVAVVLVVALVGGLVGSLLGSGRSPSTAPTTTSAPPPTAEQADFPAPPPGEHLTGPTPCPAEDGSSARVTSFSGPPPPCTDPAATYEAVLRTTVGDLTVRLEAAAAPEAVNNFVVLARYHWYEGQPVTAVLPGVAAVVRGVFAEGPGAPPAPGYVLGGPDGDPPPLAGPPAAGQVAFVPEDDTGAYAATFAIATGAGAADLPPGLTPLGTVVGPAEVLAALDRAGTPEGVPTELITITSVEVTSMGGPPASPAG